MGDLWDGESTGTRTKRRYPRFRVTPALTVSVSIRQKTFSAVTLSPRGIGFLAGSGDTTLLDLKQVDVKIRMDKFCVDVKANVKYCCRVKKPEGTFNYFGLQFVSVKPMLNNFLEKFI